jgi:mono/diheme cytochrome c family protein
MGEGMSPRQIAMIVIVVLAVVMIFLSARATPPSQTMSSRVSESAPTGAILYAQHCAICHGANLQGQPNWQQANADGSYPAPPHDASGHTWHHNDAYLIAITTYGGAAVTGVATNAMPAFQNQLSDSDIVLIIDYIKGTWPDDIKAKQLNGHN